MLKVLEELAECIWKKYVWSEGVTGIWIYKYELPFISSVGHVISKSWILLPDKLKEG